MVLRDITTVVEKGGASNQKLSIYCSAFTCGHTLWVVRGKKKKIADTSEVRFLHRVAGLALPEKVSGKANWEGSGIELLCLCTDRSSSRGGSRCSGLTTEQTQNTPEGLQIPQEELEGRYRGRERLRCSVHTMTIKILTLISVYKRQDGWKLRPKRFPKNVRR